MLCCGELVYWWRMVWCFVYPPSDLTLFPGYRIIVPEYASQSIVFNIGCLWGCMLLMDTNFSNIQHADTIKIIIFISSQFNALNLGLSCRWFYDAPRGLFRATSDVTAWGVSKVTARCHWSSVLESPFITLKSGKNDLKPSEAILCAILIAHSAHLSLHLFWGSITVYCQKLCIWLS